jgi:endonuclease/exonuclease/phosphatase family metal-dependent hydrolase
MLSHVERRPFVVLFAFALCVLGAGCTGTVGPAANAAGGASDYLFCFWNVENLFDDREEEHPNAADREYDHWFATHPEILKLKLSQLSHALIGLNDGKGPDIIALAEVESVRAADLLRQVLNERLRDQALHYEHLLMKEAGGGRHISTAIISRLPVRKDKTRLHGRRLRILEGHIVVNDHDLVVVAAHWTSRLTDKTGGQRAKYGDQIYGVFHAMCNSNPQVDLVVCGDFNDPPEAPSVTEHLHAIGDAGEVLRSTTPRMLNLFAVKDPAHFGTHYYGREWFIFDQIAVSPGLLDDRGWSCDPRSARTINTLHRPGDKQRRPWRFGNERERFERGYSDHFPVTVRLHVEGS